MIVYSKPRLPNGHVPGGNTRDSKVVSLGGFKRNKRSILQSEEIAHCVVYVIMAIRLVDSE